MNTSSIVIHRGEFRPSGFDHARFPFRHFGLPRAKRAADPPRIVRASRPLLRLERTG